MEIEASAKVFFCEICQIFQNTFAAKNLWATACQFIPKYSNLQQTFRHTQICTTSKQANSWRHNHIFIHIVIIDSLYDLQREDSRLAMFPKLSVFGLLRTCFLLRSYFIYKVPGDYLPFPGSPGRKYVF